MEQDRIGVGGSGSDRKHNRGQTGSAHEWEATTGARRRDRIGVDGKLGSWSKEEHELEGKQQPDPTRRRTPTRPEVDYRPDPMMVMTTEPNRTLGLLMRDDSSEDPLQFNQTRDAKEVRMRS